MVRLRSFRHILEVNTHQCRRSGLAEAELLREGYRYSLPSEMAVATRSYYPVHPSIVVIEVRTVQDTRCCVRNKSLLQRTGVSHFGTENKVRQLVFAA